ncbi:MAG: glutaredoxin [Candidatus Babeliales bacterium]|jgi:glutaredoxin
MKKTLFFATLICGLFLASTLELKAAPSKKSIKLYTTKNCGYCHKVIKFLKKIKHYDDVIIVDANEKYDELVKLSGGSQVPFLHDEQRSVTMLESDDIIEYFKNRFN